MRPDQSADDRTSTFAALRFSDFRLLWAGLATTGVGDSMQLFALGWLVVQLAVADGTPGLAPLYIGLVGLSRGVPGVLFGLFGGVVADRVDRRTLLILMRGAGFLVAIAFAWLTLAGAVNLAWVMGLSVASAASFAIDQPTRQAILPSLIPERHLLSAVGLSQATINISTILGPLLGGVLIAPLGIGLLLAVNSAAYVLAAGALLGMTAQPARDPAQHANVLRSLREGLAFVWQDPVLRSVVALSVALSLFARPLQTLLPAVAHDVLGVGAIELSWLLAAASVGTLAGSLGAASIGNVRRRGVMLAAAVGFAGATEAVFAAQHALLPALLFVVLPGIGHYGFSGIAFNLMQTRTPDRLRGRVIGIYVTTYGGINPLGSLLVGALGATVGIGGAIGIAGVLCLLAAVLILTAVAPLRRLGAGDAGPLARGGSR